MSIKNMGVDASGLLSAASTLQNPPEDFGNDQRVEALWAMKAMEHAEVYFNILCSVDPAQIPRLSPCDDELYAAFRKRFPEMPVDKVKEEELKSDKAKKDWREFCESFKHVEDYSWATLLRMDSSGDYSEANSIIVTKIQFYAIELARNREGHNGEVRNKFKPTQRRHRAKTGNNTEGLMPDAKAMTSEVEHELQQILSGQHKLLQ